MIHKTLKKFPEQIHVKTADHGFRIFNVIKQTGAAGKINDDPRQGFIQGYVRMSVTKNPFLVTDGFGERLA